MDDINVGRLIKSNHNFTEKVRSMILDKDLMREHYMNEMFAFKSHELISSRLASMVPGSPYAAAEEEEQAQTNPNIRSLARLKKEAEDIRIMFEDILERKVINLEILLTQLDKDNEIRNEILQQELEKEWEKKKSLIYAMNNQQLLDEHKKLAEELRVREEKRLQELKAEETRLLSRIADLDISIKRHYENIDKLQAGINQRNIRIKELEASIAGRHIRIDALEAGIMERNVRMQELEARIDNRYERINQRIEKVFDEIKSDKNYIYYLSNLDPDQIKYLADKGESFNNELIFKENDVMDLAKKIMVQKAKNHDGALNVRDDVNGYIKDMIRIQCNKLSDEMQEKVVDKEMNSPQMKILEKEINDKIVNNKEFHENEQEFIIIKNEIYELKNNRDKNRKAKLDIIEEKVGVKNEEREMNERKSENKKDEIEIKNERIEVKKEEAQKDSVVNNFNKIQYEASMLKQSISTNASSSVSILSNNVMKLPDNKNISLANNIKNIGHESNRNEMKSVPINQSNDSFSVIQNKLSQVEIIPNNVIDHTSSNPLTKDEMSTIKSSLENQEQDIFNSKISLELEMDINDLEGIDIFGEMDDIDVNHDKQNNHQIINEFIAASSNGIAKQKADDADNHEQYGNQKSELTTSHLLKELKVTQKNELLSGDLNEKSSNQAKSDNSITTSAKTTSQDKQAKVSARSQADNMENQDRPKNGFHK